MSSLVQHVLCCKIVLFARHLLIAEYSGDCWRLTDRLDFANIVHDFICPFRPPQLKSGYLENAELLVFCIQVDYVHIVMFVKYEQDSQILKTLILFQFVDRSPLLLTMRSIPGDTQNANYPKQTTLSQSHPKKTISSVSKSYQLNGSKDQLNSCALLSLWTINNLNRQLQIR